MMKLADARQVFPYTRIHCIYCIYIYTYIYIYMYISFVKMRHFSLDVKSPDFSTSKMTLAPRAKSLTSATWVLWFDFLVPWLGWQRWRQRLSMGGKLDGWTWNLIDGLGTWWFTISAGFLGLRISPVLFVCLFVFCFRFILMFSWWLKKGVLVLHDSMNSWWFGFISSRTVSSSVSHLHIYTICVYIYII